MCACSESRLASRARFSGVKRWKMAATPCQKASGAIPVPGSALSSMNCARTGATDSWERGIMLMGANYAQGAVEAHGSIERRLRCAAKAAALSAHLAFRHLHENAT